MGHLRKKHSFEGCQVSRVSAFGRAVVAELAYLNRQGCLPYLALGKGERLAIGFRAKQTSDRVESLSCVDTCDRACWGRSYQWR